MAGIAGIVVLDSHNSNQDLSNQLNSMMEGLSASKEQFSKTFSQGRFHYGVTLPMNTKPEGRYVSNRELQTDCIVDGYVFVSQQEKDILRQMYDIRDWSSDILLVPYLFDTYRNDLVNRLTGCYNLFLLDHADHVAYLFNDRLGTLPLYCYNNGGVFVFASKLDSVLSCGLMDKIEFDPVSFAEHLCFNYTLSDETYIKGVSTLKSASLIKFDNDNFFYSQFWHIENLFSTSHINSTESFDCLAESLLQAIDRIAVQHNDSLNLSLTGGWDSRIILAYMLTKYRERLNLYSFGSENSSDIRIPSEIAAKEGISYQPFVLDSNYLEQEFLPAAERTIILSGGTRNYKRSHYLYAIELVSKASNTLVSGIYGDEVIKVGKPLGGEVIAQLTIDWIASDFDNDVIYKAVSGHPWINRIFIDDSNLVDGLLSRMQAVKNELASLDEIRYKYFAYRFMLNLRKYFGAEINSYNDFGYCYSPFIDYDFLTRYSQTVYAGFRYPFQPASFWRKRMTSLLYYRLIQKWYPFLADYNTSRGYSMRDVVSISGNLKIACNRIGMSKKEALDGYSVIPTDQIFLQLIRTNPGSNPVFLHSMESSSLGPLQENLNSLYYWTDYIAHKYL